MSTTHAHFESESADCDGRYSRTWTIEKVITQTEDDFTDQTLTQIVSTWTESGRLVVTQTDDNLPKFEWGEQTEEGFRAVEATVCKSDDCDHSSTQRDHRAEEMGY